MGMEEEYLIIAQAKRGEFCLPAMEAIDKHGYDIAELNDVGDIVYKKKVKRAKKEPEG